MSNDVIIAASALSSYAVSALEAVSMPGDDARRTASAMLWADLRGLMAHGVPGKLPICVRRIQDGGTNAAPAMRVVNDTPALVAVSGDRAWGQVAATRAMEIAIERASTTGVAAVSVNDVNTAGAMGCYVNQATDAGMVGIAITNGSSIMAPSGGTARVLGNQGHAIGCPTSDGPPVVYDSALTVMSTGEIERYHELGHELPEGVLFDADGKPTTDPSVWMDGVITPVGGHRGYGMALMFEILTGVLSGGDRFAPDVVPSGETTVGQGVSLLMIAIDPQVVSGDGFLDRVSELLGRVKSVRRADGVDRIWYPGERSGEVAAERARHGVPITRSSLKTLTDLAGRLGIRPLAVHHA